MTKTDTATDRPALQSAYKWQDDYADLELPPGVSLDDLAEAGAEVTQWANYWYADDGDMSEPLWDDPNAIRLLSRLMAKLLDLANTRRSKS